MQSLHGREFLLHVKEQHRTRLKDPPSPEIQFYMNYLEQITLDYWEDQTSEYPISKLYFDQNYEQISKLFDANQNQIELKPYTAEQVFDFYDKLVDLEALKIRSNYLVAFAFQYHNIYRLLHSSARKDLSDRRDGMTNVYSSYQIRAMKAKLQANLPNVNAVYDISYMLLYDLYKVEVLRSQLQGYHLILDVVDEAFIDYFEEQLKIAEQQQKQMAVKLLTKNVVKSPPVLEKFKTECFFTIVHMRMKHPEPYLKFVKAHLKF